MHVINLYKVKWNRKYTQEDIANQTGLSKKTVSQLFSGKYHDYKLSTLETISEFFNCEISDILVKVSEKK